jgi:hypothetical protein
MFLFNAIVATCGEWSNRLAPIQLLGKKALRPRTRFDRAPFSRQPVRHLAMLIKTGAHDCRGPGGRICYSVSCRFFC